MPRRRYFRRSGSAQNVTKAFLVFFQSLARSSFLWFSIAVLKRDVLYFVPDFENFIRYSYPSIACISGEGAMSARAARLRLEEKLRNIVNQEARLDAEINALLQVLFNI